MKKTKVPNVVRGGVAVPLGRNYYYMQGRSHEQGGIDIGKNPRTGLEVEGGEVVHVGNKEMRVFSAQPFITNGVSPAQRVMRGENPNKVFNAQEAYKRRNKLNDDGTKKKRMGGLSRKNDYGSDKKPYPKVKSKDFAGKGRSYPIPTKADAVDALRLAGLHGRSDVKAKVYRKYPELRKKSKVGGLYSVTSNGKTKLYQFPSTGGVQKSKSDNSDEFTKRFKFVTGGNRIVDDSTDSQSIIFETSPFPSIEQTAFIPSNVGDEGGTESGGGNVPRAFAARNKDITDEEELSTAYQKESGTYPNAFQRAINSAKQYINNNPEAIGDAIGLVSNLIGAGVSYRLNKKMLDRMKYSSQPIARQAAKLKTQININPQLDKMRESLAAYERNVRNNTASSRVVLARQQQARLRAIMQANKLYSSKENQETALINQDRLNQQFVRNANIADYNKWAEGKAAFENAVNIQKAENTIALLDTINAGIQDVISTRSKRSSDRQTRLAMMAANPNVNPRILRDLGIKGITDKDIENWDKAYGKK